MGGPRFEQLSRATGTVRVGDGTRLRRRALRVRRQGVRRLGTFRGHAWQSAASPADGPSGISPTPHATTVGHLQRGLSVRGGGAPRPGLGGGGAVAARLQPSGEDVSVVLETAQGTTRIAGLVGHVQLHGHGRRRVRSGLPVLQQAIARYSWEGETAQGMMERSMPGDQITTPERHQARQRCPPNSSTSPRSISRGARRRQEQA